MTTPPTRRVALVGPSFHFMSGMSVYTCRLANALADHGHDVGVLLLDRLIPARLYPGGERAGHDLASVAYDGRVRRLGDVDWWWGRRLLGALRRLRHEVPDVLVLQWWTAATLHTFLVLALVARRLGIPVVLEFHEVQDTGEARIPLVSSYARRGVPLLLRLVSGAIVHHEHDRRALQEAYGERFATLPCEVAPHGPYDHLTVAGPPAREDDGVTELLFFGTIRPYKGLEDLVLAFNQMTADEAAGFRLSVVGETWEGWTKPAQLIEESPHRDRITFVNRYVTDDEAAAFVAAADVMVLPARRGSASGPLQVAMSAGLHVVMYAVPGLVAAVEEYDGAALVAPGDVAALRRALIEIGPRRAQRFDDPHSWDPTVAAYARIAALVASPRECV